VVEVGSTRSLGDRDLAGIDQLRIDVVAVRLTAHSEHPVLGLQDHPGIGGKKSATRVGWPMPRFTYDPGEMLAAT
jgi:hypothetical protein